jgi:hypothetical protein
MAMQTEEGRWARNAWLARNLGVSDMTIWRWKKNPTLNFPPAAIVNGIEYRDLNAVDQWMRERIDLVVKETA